jgi:hypothetical protein
MPVALSSVLSLHSVQLPADGRQARLLHWVPGTVMANVNAQQLHACEWCVYGWPGGRHSLRLATHRQSGEPDSRGPQAKPHIEICPTPMSQEVYVCVVMPAGLLCLKTANKISATKKNFFFWEYGRGRPSLAGHTHNS